MSEDQGLTDIPLFRLASLRQDGFGGEPRNLGIHNRASMAHTLYTIIRYSFVKALTYIKKLL